MLQHTRYYLKRHSQVIFGVDLGRCSLQVLADLEALTRWTIFTVKKSLGCRYDYAKLWDRYRFWI